MRVSWAVCLASLLIYASAARAEPSIVGNWYEDESYGGRRVIAVGHFQADGTFSVEFRECLKKGSLVHTETGQWTYTGGMLQMVTEARNGFWVYDSENYRTISNNGRVWIYKSVSGSAVQDYGPVTFHDVRVTANSKTPDCDLTS